MQSRGAIIEIDSISGLSVGSPTTVSSQACTCIDFDFERRMPGVAARTGAAAASLTWTNYCNYPQTNGTGMNLINSFVIIMCYVKDHFWVRTTS